MADDTLHELHTADLGAASFIRAKGARFLRLEGPSKLSFVFLVPRGTSYVEDFNAGQTVCAVALLRSFRWFKGIIAAAQRGGGR